MELVFAREFPGPDGKVYSLNVSLDDANIDFENAAVPFSVGAESYDPASGLRTKITADVKFDFGFESTTVTITIAGSVYKFLISNKELNRSDYEKLGDEIDREDYLIRTDKDSENVINNFKESKFDSFLENGIYALPVPDPLLGCILKSGITSTIGQVIRCNNSVLLSRDGDAQLPAAERVRLILRCLQANAGQIMKKAFWRTLRCWVTLGFG
jgi:hypothetical protein